MAANFSFKPTGKYMQNRGESKAGLTDPGSADVVWQIVAGN
jgi:hypothetical protein